MREVRLSCIARVHFHNCNDVTIAIDRVNIDDNLILDFFFRVRTEIQRTAAKAGDNG